jgi:hypothetical protein
MSLKSPNVLITSTHNLRYYSDLPLFYPLYDILQNYRNGTFADEMSRNTIGWNWMYGIDALDT